MDSWETMSTEKCSQTHFASNVFQKVDIFASISLSVTKSCIFHEVGFNARCSPSFVKKGPLRPTDVGAAAFGEKREIKKEKELEKQRVRLLQNIRPECSICCIRLVREMTTRILSVRMHGRVCKLRPCSCQEASRRL